MARVVVDLPETFSFSTELPVRVTDLNYGAHLGNDAVLQFVHEARVRFLAKHGWTEANVDGPGIIMADAAVVYASEAFWGMTLRVEVAVSDVRSRAFELLYRLTDAATGKEVARAKTGIVFFDYATRKVAQAPAAFKALFAPTPTSVP